MCCHTRLHIIYHVYNNVDHIDKSFRSCDVCVCVCVCVCVYLKYIKTGYSRRLHTWHTAKFSMILCNNSPSWPTSCTECEVPFSHIGTKKSLPAFSMLLSMHYIIGLVFQSCYTKFSISFTAQKLLKASLQCLLHREALVRIQLINRAHDGSNLMMVNLPPVN